MARNVCIVVSSHVCMKTAYYNRFSNFFFFFNDTAPTEISTLPLHDALPISQRRTHPPRRRRARHRQGRAGGVRPACRRRGRRSEEHTSELQSQSNLVCRLLLEKKKPCDRDTPARQSQSPSPARHSCDHLRHS